MRAYFIELLEKDQEVPHHQDTSMWKLLRDFLNPSDPAPCDSVEAWQSASINKKRKLAPITPPPRKRFCEQKASASPDSLASEDTLGTEENGEDLSVKYACWLPQCAAVFDNIGNMAMHVEKFHPVEYRSFLEPGIARALQAGTSQSKTNADTSELPMRNRNSTNTSDTPFSETLSVANATLRLREEGSTECTHNEHGKLWHADRGRQNSYCQALWHCDGKVLNDGLCRCAKCDLGICRSCWRKAYS